MALQPRWMHDMPSDGEDSIEKNYQNDHIETKEAADKRLADHNTKHEGPRATLASNPKLNWGQSNGNG